MVGQKERKTQAAWLTALPQPTVCLLRLRPAGGVSTYPRWFVRLPDPQHGVRQRCRHVQAVARQELKAGADALVSHREGEGVPVLTVTFLPL